MSVIDTLKGMFGQTPMATSGEAGGGPLAFLQQSGLVPEVDQKAEKRRAFARALQGLGASLSSSKQDFLPALSEGLAAGAGQFLDARDETEGKVKDRNKDLLEKMFGLANNEDKSESREQNLKLRESIADLKASQGDRRLDIMEVLGLGRLKQGDARLDQGERRIDQGDERIDLLEKLGLGRLKQGDERLKMSGERLKLQTEKAALDLKKLEQEAAAGGLDDLSKTTLIQSRIQGMKESKAKELGIDDPMLKVLDPDAHAEKTEEYRAYVKGLDETIKGSALDRSAASPATAQGAGTPQVKHSESNPAKVKSKAEYDALPPGSVFIDPNTGKMKRKPANGQATTQ